jgi:hypothetical protein
MLTSEGKIESQKRFQVMVDFLMQYFIENNQQNWVDYLNNFIKTNDL